MKKSKRVKKSNTWKIKQHRDQFFKKSKTLGYRSRAAFKLIELNNKFKFIKKNTNLLDLGSCPGGWSQVARKLITDGKVLSIDIKEMQPIYNVKFLRCDIFESSTKDKIKDFAKNLEEKGVVKFFDGEIQSWEYKKINESKRIANYLIKII